MSKKIDIIEVGPRDGFQNLKTYIPAEQKIAIIEELIAAGVRHMQITSFVSPKAIPQLRDAGEVASAVISKHPDLDLFALVPNFRGAQNAQAAGLRKVTNVISLSTSHNMANIRRTHDQSFAELEKIVTELPDLEVSLDIATAFGCPFEGKYEDTSAAVKFLKDYVDAGMTTCCLCDTIGIADPRQVKELIGELKAAYPDLALMVHFHDTRGLGMVNTIAAMESGVTCVQSALGGLGGCPFAPGASGNLSTEDMIWMLNEMGYDTGVEFSKILEAAKFQVEKIPGNYSGHHIHIETPTPCKY